MLYEEPQNVRVRFDGLTRRISGVVHDVNNMLGVISGMADMITQDAPEARKCHIRAVNIQHAVERCYSLLRSLRSEAASDAPGRRNHCISELLGKVIEQLRLSGRYGMIEVVSSVTDDVLVHCDAGEIEAAILNICVNAFEAMGDDGVLHVTVRLTQREGAGSAVSCHVEMVFRDTGPGIPPQVVSKLFEAGFSTKNDSENGVRGMGLYRVKECFTAHGGFVTVRSEINTGTEFVLTLPVLEKTVRKKHGTDEKECVPVLMIDTDEVRTVVIGSILEKAGVGMVHYGCCEEALEWLKKNAESRVLAIVGHFSGEGTVADGMRLLKAACPGIAFIMSTGRPECGIRDADDAVYLNIPLHAGELLATIDRFVHHPDTNESPRRAAITKTG